MKKIFLIILIFIFSFWNIFANTNPKIMEINIKIYKNKILKENNWEKYIIAIDKKILSFDENNLKKYSKLIEKNIKNYSWKYFNILKYTKFKIDSILLSWKKIESKSNKNIKIFRDAKVWIEFSYEAEKIFEYSELKDKNFENKLKNDKNFYLSNNTWDDDGLYFINEKDFWIWFAILAWKDWTYLNIEELKNSIKNKTNLEELTISWEKFYKYLDENQSNFEQNKSRKIKVYKYFSVINNKWYFFRVLLQEKYKDEVEKILKTIKIFEKNKNIWKKEFQSKDLSLKFSYPDEKTLFVKEDDNTVFIKKSWKSEVYALNIIKKELNKSENPEKIIDIIQKSNKNSEFLDFKWKKFLKIFLWEKQNYQIYNYFTKWKSNTLFEIEISYLKGYENEVLEILENLEFLN